MSYLNGSIIYLWNIKGHRTKHQVPIFPACVARPVGKKELNANAKAILARDKEWDNLARKGTWDLKSVREWRDVFGEKVEEKRRQDAPLRDSILQLPTFRSLALVENPDLPIAKISDDPLLEVRI